MEIEKKFLLYEKGGVFANKKYFSHIRRMKSKVSRRGKKIVQSYLHLEKLVDILEIAGVDVDFDPVEIRVRKYGRKYFLTFKDKQKEFSRNEFEVEISRSKYEDILRFQKYFLKKIRYTKKINGFNVEFDYYKKFDLLTCEVEVDSEDKLDGIPEFGKLISGVKKYKNSNLARRFLD